jgi:hypothetical protein
VSGKRYDFSKGMFMVYNKICVDMKQVGAMTDPEEVV